jgi:nucleotide-binding universal stress UspA family protein
MKKILFPTDFSSAADHAFIYALNWAKAMGGSVTTLHCYELPDLRKSHLPSTTKDVYESISMEEFENYRDNVPHLRKIAKDANLSDVPVHHVMQEGGTVHNVCRIAEKNDYDLIVMGTTGASGFKRLFLGSVASEVMENAPCPVLGVPMDAVFDGNMDNLVFTTEYKQEEINALKWLANWNVLKDAAIRCIHVDLWHIEDLANKMGRFKKNFEGMENLSFEVLDHNDVNKAITEYLDDKDVDMLAMVIHKRNFIREFFSISTTKSLSYDLKKPIFAIPEKAIERLMTRGGDGKEDVMVM